MNRHIDKQRGWVGMIVLLLALVIVAYLSKDALLKYGMMPSGETTVIKAGTPGERARFEGAGAVERADPTFSAPASTSAIDKARGVENTVKQQEGKRSGGY